MIASAHFSARLTSASPFRRARVAELQLQHGSRSGRDEGDLWLGQGLQHRTWELPLTPARVLCCSQWNGFTVHSRDGTITLGEHYTIFQWLPVKSFLFSSSVRRVDNDV